MDKSTSPKQESSSKNATLLAVVSILLWCSSGVCFRKGAEALGDMTYLTLMCAVGSLTVLILQIFTRRPVSDLYRIPRRVMAAGFFGVALYTVLLAKAFAIAEESDIGQVNLLNYLWPMWIVLLGVIILGEHPRRGPALLGAALGFVGVAISRGAEAFTSLPADLTPHFLALVGGFLWALYCVLLRRWRVPEEKGGTAFHFAVCAAMACALAARSGQWSNMPKWNAEAVFWVVYGGVGPVGLGYHFWEIGVKRGAVHLIALLAYFIPIGSTLLICVFFREAMSVGLAPGAILIALGAWLARRATIETNRRSP